MANVFLKTLDGKRILVSDGGMGTEMQRRGITGDQCPEAFNISHPESIKSIHRDYLDAGSDLVETNTFGGNSIRLARYNAEDKVDLYNRKAAELAREVCPRGKLVAGSIGPTGEILEPLGTVSLNSAYAAFARQAEALANGGVDFIIVETMMMLEEAENAVKAAKESTGLPVAATMTFDLSANGVHTSWGVTPSAAVNRLADAGADIVGGNCGNGVEVVLAAIKEMQPLTDIPLMAQPNAGKPRLIEHKTVYEASPEQMQEDMTPLLDFNVRIIGGCCGTTPEHIKRIRSMVDQHQARTT